MGKLRPNKPWTWDTGGSRVRLWIVNLACVCLVFSSFCGEAESDVGLVLQMNARQNHRILSDKISKLDQPEKRLYGSIQRKLHPSRDGVCPVATCSLPEMLWLPYSDAPADIADSQMNRETLC